MRGQFVGRSKAQRSVRNCLEHQAMQAGRQAQVAGALAAQRTHRYDAVQCSDASVIRLGTFCTACEALHPKVSLLVQNEHQLL